MISRDIGTQVPISEHQFRYLHNHNDTGKTDRDTNAFDSLILKRKMGYEIRYIDIYVYREHKVCLL